MNFAIMLISVVLVVGALYSFLVAFSRQDKGSFEHLPRDRGRALKLSGIGLLCLGLAAFLIVGVFMPGIVRDRIKEAEDLTRKTFREKIGREPDRIMYNDTDRKTGSDGWKYVGTAYLGNRVWDVTVTRSNDNAAHQTTLECEAVPRK